MDWVTLGHEAPKTGGAEPLKETLTNQKVVGVSPPFDPVERDDRRCQGCQWRVLIEGDIADCVYVKRGISLSLGVCDLWKEGEASEKGDISKERMHYAEAGYIELPVEEKVRCSPCYYYETIDEKRGNCLLWKAKVRAGQCCSFYKNEKEVIPPEHIPKTAEANPPSTERPPTPPGTPPPVGG